MNKPQNIRKMNGFGVGLISLLLLFSGMLLIVIAFMGAATLSHGAALHDKIKETNSAENQAENETALMLRKIDDALMELQLGGDKDSYFEQVFLALKKLGCELDEANKTASFTVEINENRAWKVDIKLLEFDASLRYTIEEKQIIQTENWEPEQEINLF